MAAVGATVSAEDLSLAGVTGALATALTGLTWVEAKAKLSVVIGLAAGNEAIQRGGVVAYTINGKSLSTNLDQLQKALAAVRTALSYAQPTGGVSALPVEFGG